MKKIGCFLICLVFAVVMAGCGNFTDRTSRNHQIVLPADIQTGAEETEGTDVPEGTEVPKETEVSDGTEVPEETVVSEETEESAEESAETAAEIRETEESTVVTDPKLTYSWGDLVQANKLSSVLTLYPSVKITSPIYSPDDCTRIFLHAGEPVLISEGPGYLSGQIRGCYFDMDDTGDGEVRPVIGGFYEENNSERLENCLIEYFAEPEEMKLDRIEGDLIWADCFYGDGFRTKLAVDRGTLVVREIMSLTENGEVLGITDFDYLEEIRADEDYLFLYSWDRPLRTVTVTWESFYAGKQDIRTETFSIPQDWELLPWEGRYGDYTVYTNLDYIGDYAYPGDGEDYVLFLTTVKG